MDKQRQQEALAVAEDRAGQEILHTVERVLHYRGMKAKFSETRFVGPFPPREDIPSCRTEDDHKFDSTGQCVFCGNHRRHPTSPPPMTKSTP